MPRLTLPDLDRKLALLIRHGAAGNQRGLAARLGVAYTTLRGWVTGNATRAAEQVPVALVPKLADILREMLPDRNAAECRHLLLAPAALVEDAFAARDMPELMRILRRDGVERPGRLIRLRTEGALADMLDEPEEGHDTPEQLRLGEPFRLEFTARHDLPYAIGVQNGGHRWRLFAPDRAADGRHWLVPGYIRHSEPGYIVERETEGLHLFACLQTTEPFPSSVLSYGRERNALDKRALEQIAGAYERLDSRRRSCQLIDVRVSR